MEMSEKDIDVFKEIGSIGSGNAATALSKMIDKEVKVNTVFTEITPIEDVTEKLGGSESLVMAVYLAITGDLEGDAVYILPKEKAMRLTGMMTGHDGRKDPTDEDISAYKEMSNIFTASYMSAIAELLDMKIVPSVPHYSDDMLGSVIDFLLREIGMQIDKVLMIKTDISVEGEELGGGYLMLFNQDSLDKILKVIKEKYAIEI